jgi:hypothetical protein
MKYWKTNSLTKSDHTVIHIIHQPYIIRIYTTIVPTNTHKLYRNYFIFSSKSFIHQQMHYLLILENSKIYIKTYIKIAPTCFGPRPSSGSLHLSLAKVTLM